MATVQIRKKSLKTWLHVDSQLGEFILSKFYFSEDDNSFMIVEQGEAKRRKYDITDIAVYDDTAEGTAETFTTITELSLRLEALKYPAFNRDGDPVTITGINDVMAGAGISIDKTDPQNPVISSTAEGLEQNNLLNKMPVVVLETTTEENAPLSLLVQGWLNSQTIVVTDTQIPYFTFLVVYDGDALSSRSYRANYLWGGGKGTFINPNGTTYLRFVSTSPLLTSENIASIPTTDTIDLGDNVNPLVWEVLNAESPDVTIQAQIDGYTIIKGTFNGIYQEFLWKGDGGDYGATGLQSTALDFQLLNEQDFSKINSAYNVFYINSSTGNDAIGVLGDAEKPFETVSGALDTLPPDYSETYKFIFLNNAAHIIPVLPQRNLMFEAGLQATASSSVILNFTTAITSGVSGNIIDQTTQRLFKHTFTNVTLYSTENTNIGKYQASLGTIEFENCELNFLSAANNTGMFQNINYYGTLNKVYVWKSSNTVFGYQNNISKSAVVSIKEVVVSASSVSLAFSPSLDTIFDIYDITGTGNIGLVIGWSNTSLDGCKFNIYNINNVGICYLAKENISNKVIFNFVNAKFGSTTTVDWGEKTGMVTGSTDSSNTQQIIGSLVERGRVGIISNFNGKIGGFERYHQTSPFYIIDSNIEVSSNFINTNATYPIDANVIKFIGKNTFLQTSAGQLITGLIAVTVEKRGTNSIDMGVGTTIGTNVTINATINNAGGGGGGGDLQDAYDVNEVIVTDTTQKAVKFQVGSGADTDNVIEAKNTAGTVVASINGLGEIEATAITRKVTVDASYAYGTRVSEPSSGNIWTAGNWTVSSTVTRQVGFIIEDNFALDGTSIILIEGVLKNIDTSAFSVNALLYLSNTTGVLTTTVPTNYTRFIKVGRVITSHATTGSVNVKLEYGYHPVPSASYSIVAQNTNSATTALPTNENYRDEVAVALPSTPVWNGTSPTAALANEISYKHLGRKCEVLITLLYNVAGASNTQVVIPLVIGTGAGELPNVDPHTGFGGSADNIIAIGVGRIFSSLTSLPTTGILTTYLRRNSANTGWEIIVNTGTSVAATGAILNLTYDTV